MCGDYAARMCPMWIGSWHAYAETPRISARRAVRCSNRAPIATTTSRATIRSIDASAIMDRDAIVIMIAPDLTKMTSSGHRMGRSASWQREHPAQASSDDSTAKYLQGRIGRLRGSSAAPRDVREFPHCTFLGVNAEFILKTGGRSAVRHSSP
jgi:hypothetical protein